ncbi:hypothetical protein QBC34DRAFT_429693 [Podospora aff. communis PSN243]|uniref:Uncharacterized protein n=1 Tax=Podospora aff. communis PSN243 TaxID=3040156 RepID=A0AAV9G9W7_9PEZI|nr:hypothetical protein QBC34DRAFT_429693 [Podospora aff. communis PSN243]
MLSTLGQRAVTELEMPWKHRTIGLTEQGCERGANMQSRRWGQLKKGMSSEIVAYYIPAEGVKKLPNGNRAVGDLKELPETLHHRLLQDNVDMQDLMGMSIKTIDGGVKTPIFGCFCLSKVWTEEMGPKLRSFAQPQCLTTPFFLDPLTGGSWGETATFRLTKIQAASVPLLRLGGSSSIFGCTWVLHWGKELNRPCPGPMVDDGGQSFELVNQGERLPSPPPSYGPLYGRGEGCNIGHLEGYLILNLRWNGHDGIVSVSIFCGTPADLGCCCPAGVSLFGVRKH